ncbi:hypothetical protein P1P68_00185 [Streptomyces scabiei]|uniref:hypothetical protein n=1 Tax=Streptomyces scabiei TaxID=1930 RepID=UPI00298F62C4|nr:hypothetical protein [Streptomyces scabiei]MDW8803270.1 hypothetical protein [Streptomyces scabiei]
MAFQQLTGVEEACTARCVEAADDTGCSTRQQPEQQHGGDQACAQGEECPADPGFG